MAQDLVKRRKLELSSLHLSQQELLAQDVDENQFRVVIQNAFETNINIVDRITGASVTRTMDGASTLNVDILDDKREFLNSNVFHSKIDVNTEGLWWRLRAFDKQADKLTLIWEDREVAILRGYDKHIAPIDRLSKTRAEFVLQMLKEVKELSIPYYIPDLHDPQAVFNQQGDALYPDERAKGIGQNEKLKITDSPGGNERNASVLQIQIANTILSVGDKAIAAAHPHKRKLKVCAIMTAIVESQLIELPDGDLDSKGAFQQRPSQGWPDTANTVIQANAFYEHAVKYDALHPTFSYGSVCQGVQGSAFGGRYELHRQEAENFVNAYGTIGADAEASAAAINAQRTFEGATGGYYFYRGEPPSRKHQQWREENTWNCIERLANDVNWRKFFVSGTFYFISEDDLFKSQPRAILSETESGVDSIDGNYDVNKKVAVLEANVRMGKFAIPPGCVVKVEDMGPMNGRWLASSIERDLFLPNGSITLKKPSPILLEPQKGNLQQDLVGDNGWGTPKVGIRVPQNVFSTAFIRSLQSDSKALANQILIYHQQGKYKDGNGKQLEQWRLVAEGKRLTSRCDEKVYLDPRVPGVVCFLIENGWRVGTSAICQDHDCYVSSSNPPRKSAHPQGKALDINYISPQGFDWHQVSDPDPKNASMMHDWIKEVMILLQELDPSQILCNGVAGVVFPDIQACQTNNGSQVEAAVEITDGHTDHMHVGF